jgi:phage terminase large subunit GpA-like protein
MSGHVESCSLQRRLEAYWRANPHAVMTLERICIDFNVESGYAYKVLRRMHYQGTATSTRVYLATRTHVPTPDDIEVHA